MVIFIYEETTMKRDLTEGGEVVACACSRPGPPVGERVARRKSP